MPDLGAATSRPSLAFCTVLIRCQCFCFLEFIFVDVCPSSRKEVDKVTASIRGQFNRKNTLSTIVLTFKQEHTFVQGGR